MKFLVIFPKKAMRMGIFLAKTTVLDTYMAMCLDMVRAYYGMQ